jgi:glycosyltransferase involved in cell wall biosynthesis
MRIAICKTSLFGPISGADETLVTYATELHEAGHDITVVLLYPCGRNDPYLKRLIDAGVPIVVIAERSLAFRILSAARSAAAHFALLFALVTRYPGHVRKLWQAALRLLAGFHGRRCRKFFANRRFDLLHVMVGDGGAVALISAGRSAGLPVLYHELGTPNHMPELRDSYERLARHTPLCTRIAVLSPTLARQWQGRLGNARPLLVLPLIVRPLKEIPFPRRAMPFTVLFGFAARLERGKGPAALVEAFARLCKGIDGAYLRIAGVGPLSSSLRARSRQLGLGDRCEFTRGYRSDEGRAAFLGTLDVFVLPSLAEGTPNSIIEAMAGGLPVIASAVGGIPDMVTAETGVIVPPGDVAALADAMRMLAEDVSLRRAMGLAARRRYEATYSPAAIVPLLVETYRQVALDDREPSPAVRPRLAA